MQGKITEPSRAINRQFPEFLAWRESLSSASCSTSKDIRWACSPASVGLLLEVAGLYRRERNNDNIYPTMDHRRPYQDSSKLS